MNQLLFKYKTAIITGAGGALGKSYALDLAKRGCNIVLNDVCGTVAGLNNNSNNNIPDNLKDLVNEIKKYNVEVITDTNNVTDGNKIIENTLKHFNSIDILINNAGILRDKSFHKMSNEDFNEVLKVHLIGTFSMCHNIWPIMQKQNYGRIINISSGAGAYGNFGQSNYAAAKMGIIGLSNVLSKEGIKNNIYVNTLIPVAASRMTQNLLSEELLQQLDPQHATPMVTYLAHESNKNTGKIFEVAGGLYTSLRWQRSEGILLGGKNKHIASAEDIFNNIDKINQFNENVTYPTNASDIISELVNKLEYENIDNNNNNLNNININTNINTTTTTTNSNNSNNNKINVEKQMINFDKLNSTNLFVQLYNTVISNAEIRHTLLKDLNSLIIIEIVDDNDENKIINSWILNCKDIEVLGNKSIIQVQKSSDGEIKKVKYDTKISCGDSTFIALANGKISPEFAYMRGTLKVKGQISAAMKVKSLLTIAKNIMKF